MTDLKTPTVHHGSMQITLEGPTGCGKTVLARVIARHLEDMGVRVVFTDLTAALQGKDYRFGSPELRGDYYGTVIISTKLVKGT